MTDSVLYAVLGALCHAAHAQGRSKPSAKCMHAHQKRFCCFLQGCNSRNLPPLVICLWADRLSDLTHQSLEGRLSDQQFSGPLVLPDLSAAQQSQYFHAATIYAVTSCLRLDSFSPSKCLLGRVQASKPECNRALPHSALCTFCVHWCVARRRLDYLLFG